MNSISPCYTETYKIPNLLDINSNDDDDDLNFSIEIIYLSVPELDKPFLNYYNNEYKLYYIYAPFYKKDNISTYNNLINSKYSKIGLSIYQEFPAVIKNKYENNFHKLNPIDYQNNILLWIHPFKDPSKFDLINSDKNYFFNYSNLLLDIPIEKSKTKKNIDIVIICDNYFNIDSTKWLKYYHNVSLINKTLQILEKSELNITIVDPHKIIDVYEKFNYIYNVNSINDILNISKICIVFNKHASFIPYIGNALLRNNCILMYHSILGEWNLINKYTGAFFSNTTSLIEKLNFTLNNLTKFKPKKWYLKKHNPQYKINLLYNHIDNIIKNNIE